MQRQTDGLISWLTFDLFSECERLVHGVFLRHGGVSSGDFCSLNFGACQGDSQENVEMNRKKALDALDLCHFSSLWQNHGKEIVEAKSNQKNEGDALTTDNLGLALLILHADCQAAIFYDPIHHALANVHCGWRGNVQNIYKETVDHMLKRYGSKPEDLLVGISPSLGPDACEFINYKVELPQSFNAFQFKPMHFDFWQISRWQLETIGILPHHIEIAELCTYANPDDFFSYRRLKISGRHATIAALK